MSDDYRGPWRPNEPNIVFQWYRERGGIKEPIIGATGSTYILQPEDLGYEVGVDRVDVERDPTKPAPWYGWGRLRS